MKTVTVTFLGKNFKVPVWATHLAADNDGAVWAYETKPVPDLNCPPAHYINPDPNGDAAQIGYVSTQPAIKKLRAVMKIDTRVPVRFLGRTFKVPAAACYIAVDGDGVVSTFVRKPTRFQPYAGPEYWNPHSLDWAHNVGKLRGKNIPAIDYPGRCMRIKDLLNQEAAANAEYDAIVESIAENPQVENLIADLHSGAIKAHTLFQDISSPLAVGDLVQTRNSKRIDKIERVQGTKEIPRYALETSCWYNADELILICRANSLPK